MGSGDWIKNILNLKKKDGRLKKLKEPSASEKLNGFKQEHGSQKESANGANGDSNGSPGVFGIPAEDIAATRIQTAFRAYMARKALRRLKGIVRMQGLIQGHSVKNRASAALSHLHSWSRIQGQIRARRNFMATEGRSRQKKLENQLKLEAKLHDLEVEWNGGTETMSAVLARIYQREEAAVKRERAMAYAFSHQWRANPNPILGLNAELGKSNWGWSWMECWIAARPWESRVYIQPSPKKYQSRQGSKSSKNINSPAMKTSVSAKSISPNGKGTMKARRLSYSAAEKPATQEGNIRAEESNTKKLQLVSL